MPLKDKLQITVFSIVLIGDFNPIIFQPAWLSAKGLIRENESQSCNIELIHKELVRFSFDWAKVVITNSHFSITTSKEPYFDTVKDLVVGIFKKYLRETPLSAMGINHSLHYQLNESDYLSYGNFLSPLNNWSGVLKDPKLLQLEILDRKRLDKNHGYYRIRITPSDLISKNCIQININDHYSFENGRNGSEGELMDILEETWQHTFELVEQIPEKLWNKLKQN